MNNFAETANYGHNYNDFDLMAWFMASQWCRCINACIITLVAFIVILTLLWRRESRCDFNLLSIPILSMIHHVFVIPITANILSNATLMPMQTY